MEINSVVIRKLVDTLFVEPFEGMIREMKFDVRKSATGRIFVDIHTLINDEVYRKSMSKGAVPEGGFLAVMKMNERLESILKYLPISDVDHFRYLDSSEEDMQKWNQLEF